MKPDSQTAMRQLIAQVRDSIPFTEGGMSDCPDSCNGCSVKLLEYLTMELDNWEKRLDEGENPRLGDIDQLAKTSRKVYRIMKSNGLVD